MADERPLTEEELVALRKLLMADARRQWIVSSLAGSARWLTAIVTAWVLLREVLPWVK